MEKEIRIAE